MNEHISKPVDPQRLVETVQTLVGAAREPAMSPGIDMVDALTRLGGNRALLNKVYADFFRQYADAATEIDRLIAAGRPERGRGAGINMPGKRGRRQYRGEADLRSGPGTRSRVSGRR